MPAGSDASTPPLAPELPRTWRPVGPAIAAVVFGVVLIGSVVWLWVNFDQQTKDTVGVLQKVTVLGFVGLGLFLLNGLARSRVIAREDGLTVINGYRKRVLGWSDVGTVRFPQGAPWPHLDLGDGERVSLMGIQGSDGHRAAVAVRELRAALAAHTG